VACNRRLIFHPMKTVSKPGWKCLGSAQVFITTGLAKCAIHTKPRLYSQWETQYKEDIATESIITVPEISQALSHGRNQAVHHMENQKYVSVATKSIE
jgi:hypothetical protein